MMDSTISISKACFAFKRKKSKQSPKKLKSKGTGCVIAKDDSKPDSAQERFALFKSVWKEVEDKVEEIQSEFHSDLVKGVIDILVNQRQSLLTSSNALRSEIPTVALVTGVNVADHSAIFSSLRTKLMECNYEYVATIKQKDGINIKQLIQNLVSNFMSCTAEPYDSDDEEISFKSNVKPANLNLPVLTAWYKDESRNLPSSPKKARKGRNPLIVIIENVESISSNVLQDFIQICSGYVTRLPWVFIFGLPTTVSSIHRLLPHSVSRFLSIETLQAPLPTLCLNHIIAKVVMNSSFPFKLGFKTYRLLEEIFLYHDLSVFSFMKGIKFCMMEHYYENAVSLLCCPEHEITSRTNGLISDQLEKFRQLPSVMKYVESCPAETQRELLMDDDTFKEFILGQLAKFTTYHEQLYAMLQVLHSLVSDLPTYPLGRLVREMYGSALENPIVESQEYEEAMKYIRVSARDVLMTKLIACKETLEDCKMDDISVAARLGLFLDSLKKLDEIVAVPEKVADVQKTTECLKSSGRTEFLEHLRHSAKKHKKPNAYEVLRDQIVEFLEGIFVKFLKPPKMMPLFEVFYFDNVGVVKEHLMAAPRSCIHTALSNPAAYLECECCEIEDLGTILPSMPDICIAYKLHLECGRMINLYDWLQAFIVLANSDNRTEEINDKTLQARFVRAVSELQLLGFISPTRKKTDHVARLTWGGC